MCKTTKKELLINDLSEKMENNNAGIETPFSALNQMVSWYRELTVQSIAEKYQAEFGVECKVKTKGEHCALKILGTSFFVLLILNALLFIFYLIPCNREFLSFFFHIVSLSLVVLFIIIGALVLTLKGDSEKIIVNNQVLNVDDLRSKYLQRKIKEMWCVDKKIDNGSCFYSNVLEAIDHALKTPIIAFFEDFKKIVIGGVGVVGSVSFPLSFISHLADGIFSVFGLMLSISGCIYVHKTKKERSDKAKLIFLKSVIYDMKIKESMNL